MQRAHFRRTGGSGCSGWWGGGEELEGRAGLSGVEGVGPGPAVGTRPGAWTPGWGAGVGFLPRQGRRDPGNNPGR